MPSIVETASIPALWADYFGLLDTLRESAVWRWDEDGQLLDDGRRKPPRFVAVVDDVASWERLEARVQGLAVVQSRTK